MRGGIDEIENWFHVKMKRGIDSAIKWFKPYILRETWTVEEWVWKWYSRKIKETTRRQVEKWVEIWREMKITQRIWKSDFLMNQRTWMRKRSLDGENDEHWKETSRWNQNKRKRHQRYKISSWGKRIQTFWKHENTWRRN